MSGGYISRNCNETQQKNQSSTKTAINLGLADKPEKGKQFYPIILDSGATEHMTSDSKVILSFGNEEVENVSWTEIDTNHNTLDTNEFDDKGKDAVQINQCSEDSIGCVHKKLNNNSLTDCIN